MTSSPAFVREYFEPFRQFSAPVALLQNKVLEIAGKACRGPATGGSAGRLAKPGRSAGSARCAAASRWRCSALSRGRWTGASRSCCAAVPPIPSSTISTGRWRPSRTSISPAPTATRKISPQIYGEVHFSWAIDFFEEGLNSKWLLPNRLYEGCRFGAVPIAMRETETGRFLADRHLGLLLDDASPDALAALLGSLDGRGIRHPAQEDRGAGSRHLGLRSRRLPRAGRPPAEPGRRRPPEHVDRGGGMMAAQTDDTTDAGRAHHGGRSPASTRPAISGRCSSNCARRPSASTWRSSSSTAAAPTERRRSSRLSPQAIPRVVLLRNPKKIQSAAINLAVATYGNYFESFIRIDAHGDYPADYCDRLIAEAAATGADSVVVSMATKGVGAFSEGDGRRAEFEARQWRLAASRGRQGPLDRSWPPCADARGGVPRGRRL